MMAWLENLPYWVFPLFGAILIFSFFMIWTTEALRSIDKLNREELAKFRE